MWLQRTLQLPAAPRGFQLITRDIVAALPELSQVGVGLLHVHILHTSASLCINENADPDVPRDLESSFNHLASEQFPYVHTCEGPDDMPAHVKSVLIGNSVSVPIGGGKLQLGTWQGIFLCEHRNHGGPRSVVLTIQGESR
ncbi:MAG: secondary thiamine-phosphate synthase enzyme YjbQ [Pirellulales bacterium]|nr:secondary thiamine-phosphate synthase enzyme YjbQ [Pirellulales bacterium]